jgi:hypothetical protein
MSCGDVVDAASEYGICFFPSVHNREPASCSKLINEGVPDGIINIGLTGSIRKIVYEHCSNFLVDIFTTGAEAVTATRDEKGRQDKEEEGYREGTVFVGNCSPAVVTEPRY